MPAGALEPKKELQPKESKGTRLTGVIYPWLLSDLLESYMVLLATTWLWLDALQAVLHLCT